MPPHALDRYTVPNTNLVLVVDRIAVLGAQSAPRDTANQPRAFLIGISRAEPLAGTDGKLPPNTLKVLGGVHFNRFVLRFYRADTKSMLERAQLLERLSHFERRLR